MSSFFKNCAHPDEKQRLEIGRRLGLESRQVKFWFQNRRTQLKVMVFDISCLIFISLIRTLFMVCDESVLWK